MILIYFADEKGTGKDGDITVNQILLPVAKKTGRRTLVASGINLALGDQLEVPVLVIFY